MIIEKLLQDLLEKEKCQVKSPSRCPFMQGDVGVQLKNYESGSQSVDTLHSLSQPIKCSGSSCKGALMSGQSSAPSLRTKEEVLEEAISFQQQYQASIKTLTDDEIQNRLNEIKREIDSTGTYSMAYDELVFGSKLAWRNASRCIGRIQWNKLEVLDYRHIKSTQEMFEALCKHVELATNKGNIRSTITIFPQRCPDREDFRLWNPQLINFAGYLKPDGTVIGDPGRLHFTRICQRLGWKGKGGDFDILPWILSAPGEPPKFYEIPEELVLMVNLEHPKYTWFSELGLKWYALPAVADMMLDVGGISFTAAPFNGWYMATEVGARNLCDTYRYNLSEKIAEKMGLDTSTPTSLWKDLALVEATRAVLYSFQKNKVTVVDHHTAADTFMKHMQTEQKLRGGCPADWVWIVPPISGSSTPVFHQEMVVYNLKPSFEYQDKAWISYKWNKNENVQLKYSFATLAKIVSVSLGMVTKASSSRVRATILFATETGKSETFAKRLEAVLRSSFNTRVICMEDYKPSELRDEAFVVAIASTFGSGEPPDNGKDFWSALKTMRNEKVSLKNLKYAVFALGSSQYPDFCNFGKNLDSCLKDMGAERITSLEMGDELRGQEHTFNIWAPEVYHSSCEEFKIEASEDITPELSINTWKEGLFRCVATDEKEKNLSFELSKLHNKSLMSLKVISKSKLQTPFSERQTLLVRLKATDASILKFEPGDHLAIFPKNPENVVNDILQKVHASGTNSSEVVRTEYLHDSDWMKFDRLPEASLRTYFSHYLDITSPPSSSLLYLLSTLAKSPWDRFRLKRLSEVLEDYEEWKNFRYPHLAELLMEFPSIQLDPTLLISELPLLQPRYYSISSSKSVAPDEVHITVALLSYRTQDNRGPIHNGVCTSFLNHVSDEEIPCFIRSVPKFHLPEDESTPIIMVGAGSGIAPFRSFWTDREEKIRKSESEGTDKAAFGPLHLFYGCRQSSVDNIYEKELSSLVKDGVISSVFTAFSREPECKKQYVQHKLKENSSLVQSVVSENGHIYVCGDAVMAADVRNTIQQVLKNSGSEIDVESLLESGRYHEDIFGVLHRR
uniref:Nitric oxide synthase n=1 Tax=Cupiennius salei TaxID=6928 RepID=A0A061QHR2_CUPSA